MSLYKFFNPKVLKEPKNEDEIGNGVNKDGDKMIKYQKVSDDGKDHGSLRIAHSRTASKHLPHKFGNGKNHQSEKRINE